jgi:NAD+ kinase
VHFICLTLKKDICDYNKNMHPKPFTPKNVLLMPNAAVSKAISLAHELERLLNDQNVFTRWFPYNFEDWERVPDLDGIDMVTVFGGDGTLLRAGHICAPLGIPILGVQAGRLGFLVELSEKDLEAGINRLMNKDYHMESRMMLTAELYSDDQLSRSWDVINEAVICRGKDVHPIQVRVDLREGYMNSYMSDGVIVSTATGSINHDVVLSIDGMDPVPLKNGDRIHIRANQQSLNMLRFGEPNYFYRDLAAMMQRNPILEMTKYD